MGIFNGNPNDMFAQFSAKKIKDGSTLLQLMKEKGWLIVPPLLAETK